MNIEFDLLAGLKTDDLKAELAALREELMSREVTYSAERSELDDAVRDLGKMEEKTNFIVMQLEQFAVLTTPPPESDAENTSDFLDRHFNDPIFNASIGLSAIGGVVVLSGPALKMVGALPKLSKATKLANSSKFLKVLKLGKGALALGAALAIVDLAVSMVTAQEINKQLRKDKVQLQQKMREADEAIAELKKATKEARAQVKGLLNEAGFGDLEHGKAMESYVRMMNEAIAALSAQKSKVRMVRKMVMRKAMEEEDIAEIIGVALEVVESVAQRVSVERALINGQTIVEVARDSALEDSQVIEIEKLVRARNEAIAGEAPETIAKLLGLPASIVLSEGEETLPLLASSWEDIEHEERLDTISLHALVSSDALGRLADELQAKVALSRGDDPAKVSEAFDRTIEDVAEWATDVAEARAQIAVLKRDGKLGKLDVAAARLRLPMSIAA